MKQPKTTNEHIIALYGCIKGLKAAITNIRTNDLKHMHGDIDRLHSKIDRLLYWLLGGLGATVAALVGIFK
jgi:flagellin-specific chaperone FliS